MNGSVTPNVMGLKPGGSGLFAMWRSRWFCQKHRPQATTSTAIERINRVRSSSRCSTSVICSSHFAALNRATARSGAVVRYDLALHGLRGLRGALDLRRLRRRFLLLVVLARDRVPELANALAHR